MNPRVLTTPQFLELVDLLCPSIATLLPSIKAKDCKGEAALALDLKDVVDAALVSALDQLRGIDEEALLREFLSFHEELPPSSPSLGVIENSFDSSAQGGHHVIWYCIPQVTELTEHKAVGWFWINTAEDGLAVTWLEGQEILIESLSAYLGRNVLKESRDR